MDGIAVATSGTAVSRLPRERPYDLGWRDNMQVLLKGPKREMSGKSYDIPRLNPEMLQRMQRKAEAPLRAAEERIELEL